MLSKKSDLLNADRPLECSECKKAIKVCYMEVSMDSKVKTAMCADCPEIKKRLQGDAMHMSTPHTSLEMMELVCGNCGMTLENMRRGHMLGCADCYNVFGDRLVQELSLLGKIPPRLTIDRQVGEKKMGPLHIGRSPGEKLDFDLSSKLSALNETLKESLKREDYEQAALLRDQINALTQGKVSSPKTAKGDFDE